MEGMRNESIVATGIHYLTVDNISDSRLMFRTDVWQPDDHYEQGEAQALFKLNRYKLNQELGEISCIQGKNLFRKSFASL